MITTKQLFFLSYLLLCASILGVTQNVIPIPTNFQSVVTVIQPTHSDTSDSLNIPFNTHYQVYEIALVNTSQKTQNLVLSMDNPRFQTAIIQAVDGTGNVLKKQDLHFHKNSNTLIFKTPITIGVQSYPEMFRILTPEENYFHILHIRVSDSTYFAQLHSGNLFALGVYFGLLLIVFIYILFSFFSLKQTYFLWFSFLIFLFSVKAAMGIGVFSYQSLLNPPNFDSLITTLIFVVFILFIQTLFNTKKRFPILHKVVIAIVISRIILHILPFMFSSYDWGNIEVYSRVGLLFALFIGAYASTQQKQYSAWFNASILFAFGFLTLAGFLGSFFDTGFIQINYTTLGLWLAFVLIQILLFLWSITIQVNSIANEHILLGEKIKETKKQLIQDHISGANAENNRISTQLKNLVLNEMEKIKKEWGDSNFLNDFLNIEKDVKLITEELETKEIQNLTQQVNKLVDQHQSSKTKIIFTTKEFTNSIPSSTANHLLRIIQEAIQNIEKYAFADRVEIELIQNQNQLTLTIIDNGIGFDSSTKTSGIGLTNMQERVQILDGKFEIRANPNQGVSIIIRIPTPHV